MAERRAYVAATQKKGFCLVVCPGLLVAGFFDKGGVSPPIFCGTVFFVVQCV